MIEVYSVEPRPILNETGLRKETAWLYLPKKLGLKD